MGFGPVEQAAVCDGLDSALNFQELLKLQAETTVPGGNT
jgi:hypothetical protein